MHVLIAHKRDDGLLESIEDHTKRTMYLGSLYGSVSGIANMVSLVMLAHDLGKNKKSFQQYLMLTKEEQKRLRGSVKHASTGGKFLYDLCKNNLVFAELLAYAAASHHKVFDCVNYLHQDVFLDRVTNVEDYDECIQNANRDYLHNYDLDLMKFLSLQDFNAMMQRMNDSYQKMKQILIARQLSVPDVNHRLVRYNRFIYSCLQRSIQSCVVSADWDATYDFVTDADTFARTLPSTDVIFDQVWHNFEQYMKDLQQKFLSKSHSKQEMMLYQARNTLLQECLEFAKNSSGIYKLTMFVGSGKTVSSFGYGLLFARYHPETRKIIYVAPYTNVVSQNAGVFDKIIQNDDWFLEHHSGVVVNDDDSFSNWMEPDWSEPFISTTLEQMMYVLFSDKQKHVRLFQAFTNAVIIIDEVQLIPVNTMHTLNCKLNYLHDVMGATIVLCSATQQNQEKADYPLLLSDKPEIVKNPDKWLPTFKRNKIVNLKLKFQYESLADYVIDRLHLYSSTLIILNTKYAVKKFTAMLRDRGVFALHLSNNMCKRHQRLVLDRAFEKLRKGEQVVVVSTNLIECGVDISFGCLYLSVSSLTRIIQSYGRVNRNFERAYGMLYIMDLEREHTGGMRDFLQSVRITKQILYQAEQAGELDDIMSTKWVERYYDLYDKVFHSRMDFPIDGQDETIMDLHTVGYSCKNQTKNRIMNQAYATIGRNYEIVTDTGLPVIVQFGDSVSLIDEIRSTGSYALVRKNLKILQAGFVVNVSKTMFEKLSPYMEPLSDRLFDIYVLDEAAYDSVFGVFVPGNAD